MTSCFETTEGHFLCAPIRIPRSGLDSVVSLETRRSNHSASGGDTSTPMLRNVGVEHEVDEGAAAIAIVPQA